MSTSQLVQIWRLIENLKNRKVGLSETHGDCTRKTNLWPLGWPVRSVDEFHKIKVVERNSSEKDTSNPGRRLTRIQTASRPDDIWPTARTRIGKVIEKLLFHGKRPCSQKWQEPKCLQVTEEIQLYWDWRRKTAFRVVWQLFARNSFIWKDLMKALHLLFLFLRCKLAHCCLVSRHGVSAGQNYSSYPESPRSTRYSQVWTWEERSTSFGCCLLSESRVYTQIKCANWRTESHEWFRRFWRSVSQRRLPRETESMCKRSFTPSNVAFPDAKAAVVKECKEVFSFYFLSQKSQNNNKESPRCCIDGHPPIQKYMYIPENVRKSNLKWGNNFVRDEFAHQWRFF